ncbi:MAG: protease family protein [Verrucomicrobiota bacterium]
MKDAVRLLVYFAATILIGALLAPVIFWACQWIAAHGVFPFLAHVPFERFFRRALLVAALILLWPLLRSLQLRSMRDFELVPNPSWTRDLFAGFLLAGIPLFCGGAALVFIGVYSISPTVNWLGLAKLVPTSVAVPAIEEVFFRGFILGILLRTGQRYMPILLTSGFYSIAHFLKAPDQTSPIVTWTSGFNSMARVFAQFADPMLLAASFATLFLIGLILADARMQTRSLWLPIGLHAGWIFANGTVGQFTNVQTIMLPWLGRNLLVGIVPLGIGCLTWLLMRGWIKHYEPRKT